MTTMASQITSLTVVYSTVYSDADQRKHQSSASPAFVWGSHRDRWIPRTKGQLRGKCFHLMTSSCVGALGAVSTRKTVLPGMAIPMLKIRRPDGRLIFNMEIAIRRWDGLYIETGLWYLLSIGPQELQFLQYKMYVTFSTNTKDYNYIHEYTSMFPKDFQKVNG